MNRRDILKSLGVTALAGSMPRFALAGADTRLVLVVLRGAVDGLALAAPYGDGDYKNVRGELAIAKPGSDDGLLKLDDLFGLNAALITAVGANVRLSSIVTNLPLEPTASVTGSPRYSSATCFISRRMIAATSGQVRLLP